MLDKIALLPSRIRYWMTPLLERVPDTLFPKRDRAIHVYGVGMPRSGTVSIYDCFKGNFSAAHEPESRFFTNRIVEYKLGRLSREAMKEYLLHRDRRLGLDLDSSYLNAEVVDFLVEAFPEARFILPIRDCLSWTESMMNFLLNKPEFMSSLLKPHIARYMDVQLGQPPFDFAPEERLLRSRGLHPLSAYFKYWTEHHRRVIESVPADRLLVLKTTELGHAAPEMERFLGLPLKTLKPSVHSNAAPIRHGLLAQLPREFVYAQMETHCGPLMQRYFPELMAATVSSNSTDGTLWPR